MTVGIAESGVFTAVWWALAILTVACAVLVVRLQDLVKAAMALIGSFLGIAALFVMLNAEFLAIVQVLVYAGAVSILLIFGIMMVRDTQRGSPSNSLVIPAAMLCVALLGIISIRRAGHAVGPAERRGPLARRERGGRGCLQRQPARNRRPAAARVHPAAGGRRAAADGDARGRDRAGEG